MPGFKKRVFEVIQIGNKSDFLSRFFDVFIVVVIFSNIAAMFLETFDELSAFLSFFKMVEAVTVIIFIIEYILRIWTANLLFPHESYPKAIGKFLLSYDGIVDLLTILPFFFLSGFVVFRMLRVVRIFHLFRINYKYDSFNVIKQVLYDKKNQILSSVFIIVILMFAASLGVYSAEHEAQPEAFKNAFSGIWWAVSTMLTVGYGDIYPITVWGQIMAILTAFLGVGVVAIPTGIISAGFVEQYTRAKNDDLYAAASYVEGLGQEFSVVVVNEGHSWEGELVRDLDISRLTTLVAIERGDDIIIPRGDSQIEVGDKVLIYTKHRS